MFKVILLQKSNINLIDKFKTIINIIKNVSEYKNKLDFIKNKLNINYDYSYDFYYEISQNSKILLQNILNIDFHFANEIFNNYLKLKYLKYKKKYILTK